MDATVVYFAPLAGEIGQIHVLNDATSAFLNAVSIPSDFVKRPHSSSRNSRAAPGMGCRPTGGPSSVAPGLEDQLPALAVEASLRPLAVIPRYPVGSTAAR